jgi:hypothetical protein
MRATWRTCTPPVLRRFDCAPARERVAARRGSLGAFGGLQIGQLPTKRL